MSKCPIYISFSCATHSRVSYNHCLIFSHIYHINWFEMTITTFKRKNLMRNVMCYYKHILRYQFVLYFPYHNVWARFYDLFICNEYYLCFICHRMSDSVRALYKWMLSYQSYSKNEKKSYTNMFLICLKFIQINWPYN